MHASILHSESQTGTAPSSFLLPPSSFLFPPPPRQPTGIPTSGRACECLGPSLAGKLNCECVVAWGGIGWHPRRGSRYLKLEAGVGNSMSFFVSSLAGNLNSEGVVASGSVYASMDNHMYGGARRRGISRLGRVLKSWSLKAWWRPTPRHGHCAAGCPLGPRSSVLGPRLRRVGSDPGPFQASKLPSSKLPVSKFPVSKFPVQVSNRSFELRAISNRRPVITCMPYASASEYLQLVEVPHCHSKYTGATQQSLFAPLYLVPSAPPLQ
ncbi:hypothetical protein FIBSPDRAFT_936315 [Athelia psychrophila]|uniref:Uncharacterized protein n=1 Tax=Athelia psychrophila TaxID=1759441 RepID=A0A166CA97_9AGAM|nr:hypothetical protein FIBSPDRAFT_936315 [Fibularhizoctonia sp. CBS 109695]